MNRREQERESRKNAILDAAEALFFTRSYHNVTIDDIKTEAEFSKRTIYQYFESKDQMYAAIILRAFTYLCELSRDNVASHTNNVSSPTKELLVFANSMQRFLSEREEYARMILEFENNNTLFNAADPYIIESLSLRNQLFYLLMQVIEQGQHHRQIKTSSSAEELTLILWGHIAGTMNLILSKGAGFPGKDSLLTGSFLEKSITAVIEGITIIDEG